MVRALPPAHPAAIGDYFGSEELGKALEELGLGGEEQVRASLRRKRKLHHDVALTPARLYPSFHPQSFLSS